MSDHSPAARPTPIAYLVIRDGTAWNESYQLTPGQVTTIGRASTNRMVLRDDLCSRSHCEVFVSGHRWTLRDLGSRNGTFVDGNRITGDYELVPGELIEIGHCDLAFIYDLSEPIPQFERQGDLERDTDPALNLLLEETAREEPEIVHRKRESRFRQPEADESANKDRSSRQLARLYRLALDMADAPSAADLSRCVLNGLHEATAADIGSVLLFRSDATHPGAEDLAVIAFRSDRDLPYQRVSRYLSETVLETGDAVLAKDVSDDSRLVSRDSLGRIHASSVICAPIRTAERTFGLIHLYSTNPDNPLDEDELEYTLAVADQMAVSLASLRERESLAAGLENVRNEYETLKERVSQTGEIVGDSPAVRELRRQIDRISPTDATVLIRGESGSGKELVARAMHERSNRHGGPFVTMNCAALNETLLESELFGHEKGAFTGAVGRKIGKFEQADRGTLFLDEVGEMGAAIQAKFLRVLEGHPFERVGGSEPVQVDVRVVAATNRDLEQAVQEADFRKDLYFRLQVVQIDVPPLRGRIEDIPLLTNYFLTRLAARTGQAMRRLTESALRTLMDHHWPGNIRELQHTVERSVILCANEILDSIDLRFSGLDAPKPVPAVSLPTGSDSELSLEELEQKHILMVLSETGWNKSKAAQVLGIERSTLDRKLKKYNVARPKS